MLSLLALTSLLLTQDHSIPVAHTVIAKDASGIETLMFDTLLEPLEPMKISPKTFASEDGEQVHWEFPWLTRGYAQLEPNSPRAALRIRVYSQAKSDLSGLVARMTLRMWEFNARRLRIDQPFAFNKSIVDVFLCWGGKAGGEQRFDVEHVPGVGPINVNTIYIYDLKSFTDTVEMAREVAHEYGHAVLPPVGGFETPEDWASGYLGERLYLRAFRDGLHTGKYVSADAMGASEAPLDAWVKANVDPLVIKAATTSPEEWQLTKKGQTGMDAYMGLALYMNSLLPEMVFSRSLQLSPADAAKDYPKGIELAVQEPEKIALTIPAYLEGKAIWVPLAGGRLTGAAVIKRSGNWAKIQPGMGRIYLIPEQKKTQQESQARVAVTYRPIYGPQ